VRHRRLLIALMLLAFGLAALLNPDIYGWWRVPVPF
jgi:hypothetical protein